MKINWKRKEKEMKWKKQKQKVGAERGSPDIGKWDSGFGLGSVQRPENCASILRRSVFLRPRVDAVVPPAPRPIHADGPIWSIGDVSSSHYQDNWKTTSCFFVCLLLFLSSFNFLFPCSLETFRNEYDLKTRGKTNETSMESNWNKTDFVPVVFSISQS